MPVLQLQDLTKNFGERLLFDKVSFQIEEGEKVALVGQNGSGKTTLLRCIMGEEEYDSGTISIGKNLRISYLAQSMDIEDLEQTLLEFMLDEYRDLIILRQKMKVLEKNMSQADIYNNQDKLNKVMKEYGDITAKYEAGGGYSFESKVKEMIFALGFTENDLERDLKSFSGGQKTRLYLARLLLRKPDILLLDEPTNYLDLQQIAWLENFFINYSGTLLIVSHDRYFLDKVVNRVLELDNLNIKSYQGNYSNFVLQKTVQDLTLERENAKKQEKIKRLEEYIKKNKAGVNAKQARGREKQLAKLGTIQKVEKAKTFSFAFQQNYLSGEDVITFKDLTLSYPDKILAEKLNFKIERGERIGLVGKNGCGKTTLLKAILKEIPYQGFIRLGNAVKIAYFSQEHETLSKEGTILDDLVRSSSLTVQEMRDLLARFQFKGEEIYKDLSDLSGGEKSRIILAKLFIQKANFLILDEPTNHLDIYARQSLEDSLMNFPGTLLFISHDRYFLNTIATKIIEMEDGDLVEYIGDYEYYIWKKENNAHYESLKNEKKKLEEKEIRKKENKLKKKPKVILNEIEKEISIIEETMKQITEQLGDSKVYSDSDKVKELQANYKNFEEELEFLYEKWEEVAIACE